MQQFLRLLILFIGITWGGFFILKYLELGNSEYSSKSPSSYDLTDRIFKDLSDYTKSSNLPREFQSIRRILISVHSKNAKIQTTLQNNISFPFQTSDSSKLLLQVDVIEDFDDFDHAILILQFNFFNAQTKNKIKEVSRVYRVSKNEIYQIDEQKKTRSGNPDRVKK